MVECRGKRLRWFFTTHLCSFGRRLELSPTSVWSKAWLGHACALTGRREITLRIVSELEELSRRVYVRPYCFALLHVGLNNLDLAFEWLHKGYEERDVWLAFIKCDCNFDKIQSDARFTQLCRNLGLE